MLDNEDREFCRDHAIRYARRQACCHDMPEGHYDGYGEWYTTQLDVAGEPDTTYWPSHDLMFPKWLKTFGD